MIVIQMQSIERIEIATKLPIATKMMTKKTAKVAANISSTVLYSITAATWIQYFQKRRDIVISKIETFQWSYNEKQ